MAYEIGNGDRGWKTHEKLDRIPSGYLRSIPQPIPAGNGVYSINRISIQW
jgi:hypothetical protein